MWFYLALLSAFFNALANIAHRTHGSLARPVELSWWTTLFSLPLGAGLLLTSNQPMWTSNQYLVPICIAAVLNAYGHVLIFRAYKFADASAVSPITNLIPIGLVITSFLFLGIVPSPVGLLGILLVVGGLYYSSVSGRHTLGHPFRQIMKNRGARAMLGWVGLMSVATVLTRQALDHASTEYLMLVALSIQFVLVSLFLLLQPAKDRLRRGEKVMRRWGWHIAAIAVFSTLNAYFMLKAITLVDPSYALSVKRLDVLLTVALAGLFLNEKHILKRFKGAVLALAGVAVILLAV